MNKLYNEDERMPLPEHEHWFLVDGKWWGMMQAYLSSASAPHPGQIDNSALLDDSNEAATTETETDTDTENENETETENDNETQNQVHVKLKKRIVLGTDFFLVGPALWKVLRESFGLHGREIARPVFTHEASGHCTIEVQAIYVRTYCASPDDGSVLDSSCEVIWLSPNSTISTARAKARKALDIAEHLSIRLWYSMGKIHDDSWERVTDDEDLVHVRALLVDVKDDGVEWRRGRRRIPSTVDDVDAWKAALQAGDLCDAQDEKDRWFESLIVDADSSRVQVHFKGLEDSCDEWMAKDSPRILPPYTQVPDWRAQLKVGDMVDAAIADGWKAGRVTKVDRQDDRVQLSFASRYNYSYSYSYSYGYGRRQEKTWYDLNGENICQHHTHTRASAASHDYTGVRGTPEAPGAVGLSNLGNTCFMNSMLQCLSHTVPLRDYFLSGRYEADINRTNPIGTGGRFAEVFAAFLKEMWSGEIVCVRPTALKHEIGKLKAEFAGYQQQDSHELFQAIVDALHEDLNRVKKKPYVPNVEDEGRSDEIVAVESWQAFLKRNDSFFTDTM